MPRKRKTPAKSSEKKQTGYQVKPPRRGKTSKEDPEWHDWFYVRGYQLAFRGLLEPDVAKGLGVTISTLRKWKREKPDFRKALAHGQRDRKSDLPTVANRSKDSDQLTLKERKFCERFVETMNLTQAAVDSGHSPHNRMSAGATAHQVFKRKRVQEEIHRLFEEKRTRNDINTDKIIQELKLIAFASLGDLFDEEGVLRNIEDIPEHTMRAMQAIKVRTVNGKKGEIVTLETEFKLWDKVKCLELLAKIVGFLKTNSNMTVDHSQHVHLESANGNPYDHISDDQLLEARATLERIKENPETDDDEDEEDN